LKPVTFRFDDDRIIEAGRRVSVIKINAESGERLKLMTMATVGQGGWVDLPFIAVPEVASS